MSMHTESTAPGEWVLLEVFGHRQHWGLLSEVERFGAKLARIDEYGPGDAEPVATHFYGGASIFSLTPVSEAVARERSGHSRRPAAQYLPPPEFDDFSDEIGETDHG